MSSQTVLDRITFISVTSLAVLFPPYWSDLMKPPNQHGTWAVEWEGLKQKKNAPAKKEKRTARSENEYARRALSRKKRVLVEFPEQQKYCSFVNTPVFKTPSFVLSKRLLSTWDLSIFQKPQYLCKTPKKNFVSNQGLQERSMSTGRGDRWIGVSCAQYHV